MRAPLSHSRLISVHFGVRFLPEPRPLRALHGVAFFIQRLLFSGQRPDLIKQGLIKQGLLHHIGQAAHKLCHCR